MSKEVTVYAPPPAESRSLPVQCMADVATAGQLIAQSGMLGARNPAEGFLIAATCIQEGMSFLKFGESYNVIGGRISIKAEAMLSRLLELGGEYKILSRDPEKASIWLKYKSAEYTSTLTWAEAQNESYTRGKDGKTLKDNWSTPRRRMQMLWARVVSDGVRVVCPLATRGTYTPEEVIDFDDRPASAQVIPSAPLPAADQVVSPPPAAGPMPSMPSMPSMPPPSAPALQDDPAAAMPTPFDQPLAPPAEDGVDYTVCRAPGQFFGKPWAQVDTDSLKFALKTISPHITSRDYEVIRGIIAEREAQ